MFTFPKQKSVGDEGEKKIFDFFRNHFSHILTINKLSYDPYNPHNGDLVIYKNGKRYVLEVKTDRYRSPNFFLEINSNLEQNTLGCIEASKSDFFFYYFSNAKQLYIFKTNDLKKWLNRNKNIFKPINVPNKNYTTVGIKVPIITLINEIKFYNMENFSKII